MVSLLLTGRLTFFVKHDNLTNNVQSDVDYVTAEGSVNADNRVLEYSYKINGTEKAKTQNTFDTYKRLNQKQMTVGGNTYTKVPTYNKTRIEGISDKKNNTVIHNTSYGYDCLGRIASRIDSVDSTTNNTYAYDTFGRVVRENNKALDKTSIMEQKSAATCPITGL